MPFSGKLQKPEIGGQQRNEAKKAIGAPPVAVTRTRPRVTKDRKYSNTVNHSFDAAQERKRFEQAAHYWSQQVCK